MSPILVRPVREQLEHDRIIRLLQSKCRRKFEVGMNPGSELNAPVANGGAPLYPDLVLQSLERGHRLQAVIEVETGESVNHLEALAEWAHFAKLRTAFHLYVPSNMIDVARRLCEDNAIQVHEFWSYHFFGDEARFTLVHRSKEPPPRPEARMVMPKVIAPKVVAPKVATPKVPAAKAAAKPAAKAPVRPVTRNGASSRTAPARPAAAVRRKTAEPKRSVRGAKAVVRKAAPAKKVAARAQKRK